MSAKKSRKRSKHGDDEFYEYYDTGKKLGKGNFATVKVAIRKKDKRKFAVKIIKKHSLEPDEIDMLHAEVDIMHKVDQRNCVKLYEVFDTPRQLYLVLDLLEGGELFDRIVEKQYFTERMAADVVADACNALKYLHAIGIVHRDLKPENLVYRTQADDADAVLTDFGLAKFVRKKTELTFTQCGTPGYVAPEVLAGRGYDSEVDMWSVGVILYIMLCGYPPFYSESGDDREIYNQIQAGKYDFPPEDWDHVSAGAKDLVNKLMIVNPKKRLTAAQVLKHPWVTHEADDNHLGARHMANLKSHHCRTQLREAVEAVMACNRFKHMIEKALCLHL